MAGSLHDGNTVVVSPGCPENGGGGRGGRNSTGPTQVKTIQNLPEGSPDVTAMESIGCFEDLLVQTDLSDRQGNGADIDSEDAGVLPTSAGRFSGKVSFREQGEIGPGVDRAGVVVSLETDLLPRLGNASGV